MTSFSSSPVKGLITLKNTKSYRLKFARRFLRSLMEIRRRSHPSHHINISSSFPFSSDVQIRKQSQRIKMAAYSSMAHAVGPRKAWTRALLIKLHNRKRFSFVVKKRSISLSLKKKKNKKKRIKAEIVIRENNNIVNDVFIEKTEKLREVVPGGKDMDVCSLFEETAHFIQCLALQVQVMQDIADHLQKP